MKPLSALIVAATLAYSATSTAQPAGGSEYPAPANFPECLSGIAEQAARQGINSRTRADIIPELKWLPEVIALDRRQPEFTLSFDRYFTRAVSEQRIEAGRKVFRDNRKLLDSLEKQYGVPGRYLVAFWGLETNYGGYLGNTSSLDALATLACDTRRSDFFRAELLAALRVVEKHRLDPQNLVGSWAGALGQVQFMPSNYLRYGKDGDGDGRVDLFASTRDALTSAAYFLNQLGWLPEQRWGREVQLPERFDYGLADGRTTRPLAEWKALGVRNANGAPLPVAAFDAALLVPAGHRGAAFLTYQNFAVTKRWNNSDFYALAVGHLADRIVGSPPLVRAPQGDTPAIRLETVQRAQEKLNALGFALGKPDGIIGPGTRGAIRDYQIQNGLIPDGYLDKELLHSLRIFDTP